MPRIVPEKQREFAVEVVRQLRDHGFDAYWAGGCVRDHLLSRTPYDYDVATSAHPEQIRGVFRHRKTLAIGAAFGVMTVVGPRGAGQVEVTTFRQDVSYSDGRHPDQIAFSSPEEDAKRRDFTINGMFYDPLQERIIDFVGGEADLREGVIRAIGDPGARFTEDKLRMLRAVRFASIFNFRVEESTRAAIHTMASQVTVVSAERIAAEMRIVLVHPSRQRAVELLHSLGLLTAILPEATAAIESENRQALVLLESVQEPSFPLALAVLLHAAPGNAVVETVGERWRLARKEIDLAAWIVSHQQSLAGARRRPWSQLQPLLIHEGAEDLVKFHTALAARGRIDPQDVAYCQTQLQRTAEELDPPPLLTGSDLIALRIPRGPAFAKLLREVRAAQLDGALNDRSAALEFVRAQWQTQSTRQP